MKLLNTLSKKQRTFVEAYDGDEIYAAKVAGYNGADSYLRKVTRDLLAQPLIVEAIKERSKYMAVTSNAIATREERQKLWTDIMKNQDPHRKEEVDANGVPIPEGNIPLPIRLKASELLGKSEADFVDKIDMAVQHSLSELVMKSYKIEEAEDLDIEAIEAEYTKHKTAPQITNIDDII